MIYLFIYLFIYECIERCENIFNIYYYDIIMIVCMFK